MSMNYDEKEISFDIVEHIGILLHSERDGPRNLTWLAGTEEFRSMIYVTGILLIHICPEELLFRRMRCGLSSEV